MSEEKFSLTEAYGMTTIFSHKWINVERDMDAGLVEQYGFLFQDENMDMDTYALEQDFFGGTRIDVLLFPSDRYSVSPLEFSRDVKKAGCRFVGIKGLLMVYPICKELFIPRFDVVVLHREVKPAHRLPLLLYDGSIWKSKDVAKDLLIGSQRRRGVIIGKSIL